MSERNVGRPVGPPQGGAAPGANGARPQPARDEALVTTRTGASAATNRRPVAQPAGSGDDTAVQSRVEARPPAPPAGPPTTPVENSPAPAKPSWRERLTGWFKAPTDVEEPAPGLPKPTGAAPAARTTAPPTTRTGVRPDTGSPGRPTTFASPVSEPDRVPGRRPEVSARLAGTDTAVLPATSTGKGAPATPTSTPLAAAKARVGTPRSTRKARLRLARLDPWSVMKTAFLFSIAAGIVLVVASYAVWAVLQTSGLFDSINDIVKSVVSTPGDTTPFRVQEYVNTQKVMGVSALIAVMDVLIFTALATLASFLYNLAATVLGGLEVTLAED